MRMQKKETVSYEFTFEDKKAYSVRVYKDTIDGRMNNLPSKPRKIGQHISVLDRLHLKQEEIAKRSGKPVTQMNMAEDMERRRK